MQLPNYEKLEDLLKDKKEVAILTHSNPDPDAIGSALGIQLLLEERFGIKSEIFYSGQINHSENKSLVNLTGIKLNNISLFDKAKYQNNVVIVDAAKNDLIETPLAVIDHHEIGKNEIKTRFKYIKRVGACVTLVLDMLSHYGIKLDRQKHNNIITAMIHGIRSDTDKLTFNRTGEDIAAYVSLDELVDDDYKLLRRIEHPPKTPAALDVLANAIKNREVKGNYLIAGVGLTEENDAIPEAADHLLELEGIGTTVVYGIVGGRLVASIRTENPTVNAAEFAKAIFGEDFAGGKINAAGAQVPLDFFDVPELKGKVYDLVNEITLAKFYKVIKTKKEEK